MVDVARARKLAVRIREVVSMTLETQVKDPRLGMVTITDAKVTPDLREATLYYTVYGSDEERHSSAAALESARGRAAQDRRAADRHALRAVAAVRRRRRAGDGGRLEIALERVRHADAERARAARAPSTPASPTPTAGRPTRTTRTPTSSPTSSPPTSPPPPTVRIGPRLPMSSADEGTLRHGSRA